MGAILHDSRCTFGAGIYDGYLIDSGFTPSSNFPVTDEVMAYPPVTTPGLAILYAFLYHAPFQVDTIIDGPVEGNVVIDLWSNIASPAKVSMTQMSLELYLLDPDGSPAETLSGEVEIFPCTGFSNPANLVGIGSSTRAQVGVFFAFPVQGIIPAGKYLSVVLKVYGYRSSSSTNMAIYLKANRSDADFRLSIPVVGV